MGDTIDSLLAQYGALEAERLRIEREQADIKERMIRAAKNAMSQEAWARGRKLVVLEVEPACGLNSESGTIAARKVHELAQECDYFSQAQMWV